MFLELLEKKKFIVHRGCYIAKLLSGGLPTSPASRVVQGYWVHNVKGSVDYRRGPCPVNICSRVANIHRHEHQAFSNINVFFILNLVLERARLNLFCGPALGSE